MCKPVLFQQAHYKSIIWPPALYANKEKRDGGTRSLHAALIRNRSALTRSRLAFDLLRIKALLCYCSSSVDIRPLKSARFSDVCTWSGFMGGFEECVNSTRLTRLIRNSWWLLLDYSVCWSTGSQTDSPGRFLATSLYQFFTNFLETWLQIVIKKFLHPCLLFWN